jgi:methyltransferase OMS1
MISCLYQDATAAPVAAMSKGCVYNQDVRRLAEQAGLRVLRITPSLGGLIVAVEAVKA